MAISLLVFLAGCQRGCTTTKTLDSETIEKTVNGEKIKITCSVIDYRNSRAINRNIFKRSVTHTYGLSFRVEYDGFEQDDFYLEAVSDPDAVDLGSELKRVKIKLSKNKKHLALGIDSDVVDIIHLYKKERLATQSAFFSVMDATAWDDLDIESFKDPEDMMRDELRNNCNSAFIDNDILERFADDVSPSDSVHSILLSHWPHCSFALTYYNPNRTKQFKKNSTWKRQAINRGLELLGEGRIFMSSERIYAFLKGLDSKEINVALDSVYVENWGRSGYSEITQEVFDRLKSKTNPFSDNIREQIIADARENIEEFIKTGRASHRRDYGPCMQVVLISGDTSLSHTFLQDALAKRVEHYNVFDMIETVYENYELYTSYQQALIKRQTPEVFGRIKHYGRDQLFEASSEIVGCDQLKKWKKEYADDLEYMDLPKEC